MVCHSVLGLGNQKSTTSVEELNSKLVFTIFSAHGNRGKICRSQQEGKETPEVWIFGKAIIYICIHVYVYIYIYISIRIYGL